DWSRANSDGTFGNRFDDPEGYYRVLYAASQKLSCFLETLARFRPDLSSWRNSTRFRARTTSSCLAPYRGSGVKSACSDRSTQKEPMRTSMARSESPTPRGRMLAPRLE
ncbi:MAG TPA: hypothetical protein VGS27_04900, partial [Candidatus Sulfotelmatobacter sp.]|nr:hypothetical protein [Candidatus Sulfotelmatobacter sp.]